MYTQPLQLLHKQSVYNRIYSGVISIYNGVISQSIKLVEYNV